MQEVKNYVDNEMLLDYPKIEIKDDQETKDGQFFHFCFQGFSFSCLLSEVRNTLLTVVFYDYLDEDEIMYWNSRYRFRLLTEDPSKYNHTLGVNNLRDFIKGTDAKAIMVRLIPSCYVFKRDLRYITKMAKYRKNGHIVKGVLNE